MGSSSPRVSILVVVDGIARQAKNTLETLSPSNQRNVREEDYELIVVERASANVLGEGAVRNVVPQATYSFVDDVMSLPMAVASGIRACRAPVVGLLFDGATLVTPRVVEHAILATRLYEDPLIGVPSYQLGSEPQHASVPTGYDESSEAELLAKVDFRTDGYELFNVSCRDPAFQNGFLAPFSEAALLFASRERIEPLLEDNERFELAGALSAYLFGNISLVPAAQLVVLASEGTFHQVHDCLSTFEAPTRRFGEPNYRRVLRSKLPPPREPALLGAFSGQSMFALLDASRGAVMFHGLCVEAGRRPYPLDET